MANHIATVPHESKGNLIYSKHGVDPYWALRSAFNDFGPLESDDDEWATTVEVDGEEWEVTFSFQRGKLLPRPSDSTSTIFEYRLVGRGPGQKKASFHIAPRWEDDRVEGAYMATKEGVDPASKPAGLGDAINVRFDCSHVELENIPTLWANFVYSGVKQMGSYFKKRYLTQSPHRYSNITAHERWVRLTRSEAKKLTRKGGLFDRLFYLVGDHAGTYVERVADNRKRVDWRQEVQLNDAGAQTAFPGRQHGKRLKCYYPQHPEKFDPDDPLYHPAFRCLFQKTRRMSSDAVPWRDREQLVHELESTIVNSLEWAGIPIEPTETVYVQEQEFDVVASDRAVDIHPDPTPEMEAQQESIVIRTLVDMLDSDEQAVRTLLADGGREGEHYEELSEETGLGISTLYDILGRLEGVIESDNGYFKIKSEQIRQKLLDVIERTESVVESGIHSVVGLANFPDRAARQEDSAWAQFLAEYGPRVTYDEEGTPKIVLDIVADQLKSTSVPRIQDVIKEMKRAWCDSGREEGDLLGGTVAYEDLHSGSKKQVSPATILAGTTEV